jgi:hypothetical protein
MRIAFHSPSLHVLGGGEKYFLTLLREATRLPSARVTLLSPAIPSVADWEDLGVSLAWRDFTWAQAPGRSLRSITRGFDLFVTNQLVPPVSRARRSIAIVQYPARDYGQHGGLPPVLEVLRRVRNECELRALLGVDI